ncbi:MAG: hypothetical protein D6704_10925 [Nitrospirae bacterium]|nr:MAG: hypothetical protein D6704_10925 [Nitrospirota bacterium]
MTTVLGRPKSARRAAVEAPAGVPQRGRQAAEAGVHVRDDHRAAATGARAGQARRQSDPATIQAADEGHRRAPAPVIPAWLVPRGL